MCGAACRNVYGPTQSPNEDCFKTLAKNWSKIDTKSYKLPCIKGDFLIKLKSDTKDFLEAFLDSESSK